MSEMIVELPQPEWGPDGSGSYGFGNEVSCDEFGQVWLADTAFDPQEARELAASLLAAADMAEPAEVVESS